MKKFYLPVELTCNFPHKFKGLRSLSLAACDGTLERIMLQKYLALYFNDYQQWFEYRRTGLPNLPKTESMMNNKMVPVRFRYPAIVQQTNRANYDKAVANMGGDDINTKVWWEK